MKHHLTPVWDVIEWGAIGSLAIITGIDASVGLGGQFPKCPISAVLGMGPLAYPLGQVIGMMRGCRAVGKMCHSSDDMNLATRAGLPRVGRSGLIHDDKGVV
jgi:hypothetical protein